MSLSKSMLPYFERTVFEGKIILWVSFIFLQRSIRSIKDFVKMKDEDRRNMLRNLSPEEYQDIMNVCAMMPHVTMTAQPSGKKIFTGYSDECFVKYNILFPSLRSSLIPSLAPSFNLHSPRPFILTFLFKYSLCHTIPFDHIVAINPNFSYSLFFLNIFTMISKQF